MRGRPQIHCAAREAIPDIPDLKFSIHCITALIPLACGGESETRLLHKFAMYIFGQDKMAK